MPQRHPVSRRVTTVERFTAVGAAATLESGLRAYARHRQGLRGYDSGITVRLLDRSGSYVRLEQWRGVEALLRSTHAEGHLPHLASVSALAGTEHELTVSVGSMPATVPIDAAARLVLVRAEVESEPAGFEMDFGALVGSCVTAEGYGGSDLLRSVSDPRAYTGLLWWRSAPSYDHIRSTPTYQDRRTKLTTTAHITELHALPLPAA